MGFLDTCSFQPPWCRKGWWLLGVPVGAAARGISLAVSQEGHQEPAFLEDIAARRKDPDF